MHPGGIRGYGRRFRVSRTTAGERSAGTTSGAGTAPPADLSAAGAGPTLAAGRARAAALGRQRGCGAGAGARAGGRGCAAGGDPGRRRLVDRVGLGSVHRERCPDRELLPPDRRTGPHRSARWCHVGRRCGHDPNGPGPLRAHVGVRGAVDARAPGVAGWDQHLQQRPRALHLRHAVDTGRAGAVDRRHGEPVHRRAQHRARIAQARRRYRAGERRQRHHDDGALERVQDRAAGAGEPGGVRRVDGPGDQLRGEHRWRRGRHGLRRARRGHRRHRPRQHHRRHRRLLRGHRGRGPRGLRLDRHDAGGAAESSGRRRAAGRPRHRVVAGRRARPIRARGLGRLGGARRRDRHAGPDARRAPDR